MRASWKKLVQTALIILLIWIVFNFFTFYWRNRKVPSTSDFQAQQYYMRGGGPIRIYKKHLPTDSRHVFGELKGIRSSEWTDIIARYRNGKSEQCDGKFFGFQGEFSMLKDVILRKRKAIGRPGGEEIKAVLNQREDSEFYKFQPGFFTLPCSSPIQYQFELGGKNHLNSYFGSLQYSTSQKTPITSLTDKTVFVVTRYEYVNLYHSMTDFYNAFMNMDILGLDPDNVTVLFVDGHPKGGLDSVWSTLFSNFIRLKDIQENQVLVKNMVWVQMSYASPLIAHRRLNIPATELFRRFFLQRYNVTNIQRKLDCAKIRVTFIWRRDYVAHPRNPSGHVVRKIKNEDELVAEVEHEFRTAVVFASQIDLLPMKKQLQTIADTDILIGMHGAGLTHALFLPRHAGLVEMYPTYWSEGNVHFKKIADWRRLLYQKWVNHNPRLEYTNHYTRIPAGVVSSMVRQILHGMKCSQHHR